MEPCPECGADAWEIDARRNERVCTVCGLVEDAAIMQPELPPSPEPAGKDPGLGRLRHAQRRALHVTGSQQRLRDAAAEAKRLTEAMGCPIDIAERAALVLRRARKAGLTQGRDLDAMAAAAVLASCRMLFLTRPPKEVAAASRVDEEAIQHAYKALVAGLKLPVPAMSAHQYLAQVAAKVDMPQSVVTRAQRHLSCICGTARAAGKNPMGWAAAGLVVAAREDGRRLSVNAAAKAAGVSGTTVAARIEDLEIAACAKR